MTDQPTDWPAAAFALAKMDGAERDKESARLNTLWKAEYIAAFVAYAVSRKSRKWTRENAKTWAAQIVDDALNYGDGADPLKVARGDVLECEREARNAG